MRSHLEIKSAAPDQAATDCIGLLDKELLELNPVSLIRQDNGWLLHGGPFRSAVRVRPGSYNVTTSTGVTTCVTSALFQVRASSDGVVLLLQASFGEILGLACFFSMLGGLLAFARGASLSWILAGVSMPLVFIFGGNYLVASSKLLGILNRVGARAKELEHSRRGSLIPAG